jgi:peptidoglycan/LPS O-acetylase OafA/YrhL
MFFRIFNLFYFENSSWKRDFQLTHSRLDSLFFGTVTFFIYHKKNKVYQFIINNKNWLFCIAFLVVILNYVFLRDIRLLNIVLLSFNSIAFGTLLIILLNSNKFAEYNLIKRVSVIGKYSYGIYLLHPFIGVFLPYIKKYVGTGLLLMVIYITIAITTGIVYSKLIEYPFLKLRDKYFPSKAKSII